MGERGREREGEEGIGEVKHRVKCAVPLQGHHPLSTNWWLICVLLLYHTLLCESTKVFCL